MKRVSIWARFTLAAATLVATQSMAQGLNATLYTTLGTTIGNTFDAAPKQPTSQPSTQPADARATDASADKLLRPSAVRAHEGNRGPREGNTPREGNADNNNDDRDGNRKDRGWGMSELRQDREGRDRQGNFMQGRPPGDRYEREEAPTEEEWDEIVEFMAAHSPNRLEVFKKLQDTLGEEHQRTQGARRRLVGRYRDLEALKERNSEMYDFAFKQAVIEDQVFGTLRELHDAADEEPLRQKFRAQVKDYMVNFYNEREARLKKLRELVEKETATIAKDRAAMDKLVEKQMQRFEREMSRMVEFDADPDAARPTQPANNPPN